MRPSQLIAALDYHCKNGEPAGVVGPPGVGKSDIIRQVAKDNNLEVITMNLVMSDPTDLKGLPFLLTLEDGTRVTDWVKQRQLLQEKPFCLFLDEVFQAPTATQNVAAPIILEGRVDDIYLPKGTWVPFASNRMEDKAGTTRVPSHLPNRATIYFGPDVNVDDWAIWALERDLHVGVVQYLRMKPSALHDFDPSRLVNATPRQWGWVAKHIASMPESIMYATVAGRVGEGFAAELKGFLAIADELPPKEKILMDPKRAPVPEEVSALYLVTGMLAQAATENNFDAIATYMERVPPEFQAMLVNDAWRRCPGIATTKAFSKWGLKFAEVLA